VVNYLWQDVGQNTRALIMTTTTRKIDISDKFEKFEEERLADIITDKIFDLYGDEACNYTWSIILEEES
jgi:hypothetical protein